MEITGGLNWQLNTCTCTSTIWNPISVPPVPHMVTFMINTLLFKTFWIYKYNIEICIEEVGKARNVFFLILMYCAHICYRHIKLTIPLFCSTFIEHLLGIRHYDER